MDNNALLLALVILGILIFASIWLNFVSQRISHEMLEFLHKTHQESKEPDYVDSDLYKPLVDLFRLHGYTDWVNYRVSVTDNVICRGGVTRRGLVSLLGDVGFPSQILHTPMGMVVIKSMVGRRIIGCLDSYSQIDMTFDMISEDHYKVVLRYTPTYADDCYIDRYGNAVDDMWLTGDDLHTTVTDIILKDFTKFSVSDSLPAKYHDNFRTLMNLGSCITGANEKYKFEFASLDINSTKSSNPTLYARMTMKQAPGYLMIAGLDGCTVGEEFNQYMISQHDQVVKYALGATYGYLRTLRDGWYEDIQLILLPYDGRDESNLEEGYYLDITITKRRAKNAAETTAQS